MGQTTETGPEPVVRGPMDIAIQGGGLLVGTLGKGELKFAAACIVLYHQENQLTEWSPIKTEDFFAWVRDSEQLAKWLANPFWNPNFVGLIEDVYRTRVVENVTVARSLSSSGTTVERIGELPKLEAYVSSFKEQLRNAVAEL